MAERLMKDSGYPWIGCVPNTWGVRKIKNYYSMQTGFTPDTKNPEYYDDENGFDWINISDMSDGAIIKNTKKKISEKYVSLFAPKQIPEGSLLYSFKLSVGQTSFAGKNIYSNEAIASFLKTDKVNLNYLRYSSMFIVNNAQKNIYNADILNQELINNAVVPFPPLHEQSRIANFLDKKVSEIDNAIEKTKQSIEEYKKLKQSVITEAVTKGLDPNAEMKDSGNIDFPDIPSHWKTSKLKHVFSIKKDIAGKDGIQVLSITQKGIIPKNINSNEGQIAADYSNYQLVEIGDFAMNHMDLLTGWIDISKYNGVTSPDYRVFVLNDKNNNCDRYYLYFFQMCYFNKIFYHLGQGVSNLGRWRLQADKFLNFTIPVCSKKEQVLIADYLDKQCSKYNELISKKEQIIIELEQYKKSLIYEYVTGKKEVA